MALHLARFPRAVGTHLESPSTVMPSEAASPAPACVGDPDGTAGRHRLRGCCRVARRNDHSSAPVVEVDEAAFESQLASHRFAYGGDGASFVYGSSYELTIVNGFLAVSVPSAGDPPSGDVPTVVSLRSSDALCVSQQPTIDFEQRPPHHPPREGRPWEAEAVAAAGPHAGARYAWTDCVLVDLQRHLTLKLRGNGPASNILGTASQFRDALRQVHAGLIG